MRGMAAKKEFGERDGYSTCCFHQWERTIACLQRWPVFASSSAVRSGPSTAVSSGSNVGGGRSNLCLCPLRKRLAIKPSAGHEHAFRQFRHTAFSAEQELVEKINAHRPGLPFSVIKASNAAIRTENMKCDEACVLGHPKASGVHEIERLACAPNEHVRPMFAKPTTHLERLRGSTAVEDKGRDVIITSVAVPLFVKERGLKAATGVTITKFVQEQTGTLVTKLSCASHQQPHIKEVIGRNKVMSGISESAPVHHDGEMLPFQVEMRERTRRNWQHDAAHPASTQNGAASFSRQLRRMQPKVLEAVTQGFGTCLCAREILGKKRTALAPQCRCLPSGEKGENIASRSGEFDAPGLSESDQRSKSRIRSPAQQVGCFNHTLPGCRRDARMIPERA